MKRVTNSNTNTQNIDVIATKLDYIQSDVAEIKAKLDKDYVTNDEFDPIRRVVYGMVSVVLLAVVGAMVALVVRTQ